MCPVWPLNGLPAHQLGYRGVRRPQRRPLQGAHHPNSERSPPVLTRLEGLAPSQALGLVRAPGPHLQLQHQRGE